MNRRKQRPRGFTLIEVTIAIALGSLAVFAATSLYLSVVRGWAAALEVSDENSRPEAAAHLLQMMLDRSADDRSEEEATRGFDPPASDPVSEPVLWVRASGDLFAAPELGPLRCFLRVDDGELLAELEPSTLRDSRGSPALLPVPLLEGVEGLVYWFYDTDADSWESLDDPDPRQLGTELTYEGNPLEVLEIRFPEASNRPSIWIQFPVVPETEDAGGGSGEGTETPAGAGNVPVVRVPR